EPACPAQAGHKHATVSRIACRTLTDQDSGRCASCHSIHACVPDKEFDVVQRRSKNHVRRHVGRCVGKSQITSVIADGNRRGITHASVRLRSRAGQRRNESSLRASGWLLKADRSSKQGCREWIEAREGVLAERPKV